MTKLGVCKWCGSADDDVYYLSDWLEQQNVACTLCLESMDIDLPYEPTPVCVECSSPLDEESLSFGIAVCNECDWELGSKTVGRIY